MDRSFLIQLKGEMNQRLIELTSKLYRLTLFFPKKEPLRYKMRELADDILANPKERDLEVLDSFLEVAFAQNWVSPSDILAIRKEYDNLKEELKEGKSSADSQKKKDNPIDVEEDKSSSSPFAAARVLEVPVEILPALPYYNSNTKLPRSGSKGKEENLFSSPRQEKILAFLKENGRAQVWQVKQILPEVTKRTLRRDFENMLGQGIIERVGEKNDTFYQIPSLREAEAKVKKRTEFSSPGNAQSV
jgi:hypothetical protein